MQSFTMNLIHRTWIFAVVLLAGVAFQTTAYAGCTATTSVDSTYQVEQTVCIDQDGLGNNYFGYVETDSNGYGGEYNTYYLDGLGSEVTVSGPGLGLDSGMQYFLYDYCCSYAETSEFSVSSGNTISDYSANGYYAEYLYPVGAGVDQGEWYGTYSGLSYP